MINLFLKRIKYNLKGIFSRKITIPSEIHSFKYNHPKFADTLVSYLLSNNDKKVDAKIRIFGKEIMNPVVTEDIFSSFQFNNHRRYIPAYFNKGDVKVPYEASRLQYLQKFHFLSVNKINYDIKKINVDDFPLLYWNSPMDVAIRNINLILHRMFLELSDLNVVLLENDMKKIDSYISQHYKFVNENLENKGNVVGNHYLVELASILFTLSIYKFENCEEEIEYFLNELSRQLDLQFFEEGTNFEGSSHYSALVVEALMVCKFAIEQIDENSSILRKIEYIILSNKNFLNLLMINGELSQIGDNDSGRIFYYFFDEKQPLNMNWLIEMIDYFYEGKNKELLIENYINDLSFDEIVNKYLDNDISKLNRVVNPNIKIFTDDFELYSFKEFGIYIWKNRSGSEYFSIRCGKIGQNGVGGHSHYDQLSIECFTNNKWIARDPGTGTYTDNIEVRNDFRSTNYHWGPKADVNLPIMDEFDCFKLHKEISSPLISDGKVLYLDKYNFLGSVNINGKEIFRKINFQNGNVIIEDFSYDCSLEEYRSWGENNFGVKEKFSNGYKRYK